MIGPGIPGAAFDAYTEGFEPGLVGTIGVRIVDPDGNVLLARTTTSIIEIVPIDGNARYRYAGVYPTLPGSNLLIWDDGSDELSDSEVIITAYTPQAVLNPAPSDTGPTEGPCTAWITAADVAACCESDASSDVSIFDTVAIEATMLLYELSGRKYTGQCFQTVRPCRTGCGCFGGSAGVAAGLPYAYAWGSWGGGWWGWSGDGCGGNRCGCGALSQVKLAGYPVSEIIEVKIAGEVVDPDTYRLDGWRWLTRLGELEEPRSARYWPSCQRLDLPDTEPGTFSVEYRYGVNPPLAGERAAAQLACELYKACTGAACALPAGVTKITRQGVEISRALFLSWALQTDARGSRAGSWSTGLTLVDAFLSTYNRNGLARRPAVWSPDTQKFARKLGT